MATMKQMMLATAAMAAMGTATQAVMISTTTAVTQNFDGIGTSATATLPTDWKADKITTGARTVGTYATAGTATERNGGDSLSSSASNGIYNFGDGAAASATDRSVGGLSSGSATQSQNTYVQLTAPDQSLDGLQLSYNVEKYRSGSNAAGFRIALFYSTDGSTWTAAGDSFSTVFAADANNNGFADAPGASATVSGTLNVAIPANSTFYLAWNYSVASGTTTSNAQALGIDNVSITGVIPEPASLALVALGGVAMFARRRSA